MTKRTPALERPRTAHAWQDHFAFVFQRPNATSASGLRYTTRIAELAGFLTSSKHQRRTHYPHYYARFGAWLFGLANYYKFDLQNIVYMKFPEICPYCRQSLCVMTTTRPSRVHGEYDRDEVAEIAQKRLAANRAAADLSLEQWSDLINRIYPRNWDLGIAQVGERFHEECSEFIASIRRYESSLPEDKETAIAEVHDEAADVFCWYVVLGRTIREAGAPGFQGSGTNLLDDFIWDVYERGCTTCNSRQCTCQTPDLERLRVPTDLTAAGKTKGHHTIVITDSHNVNVAVGEEITQKMSVADGSAWLASELERFERDVMSDLLYSQQRDTLRDAIAPLVKGIRDGNLTGDAVVTSFARVKQTDFRAWDGLRGICTHALDITKQVAASAIFEALKYGLFAVP